MTNAPWQGVLQQHGGGCRISNDELCGGLRVVAGNLRLGSSACGPRHRRTPVNEGATLPRIAFRAGYAADRAPSACRASAVAVWQIKQRIIPAAVPGRQTLGHLTATISACRRGRCAPRGRHKQSLHHSCKGHTTAVLCAACCCSGLPTGLCVGGVCLSPFKNNKNTPKNKAATHE